ncbi:UvrD-helicase domain-containing protein [Vogesella urethralis]|uniref:UvrD-helicase domain-containing protein n=1 Tax=Vogesella urethralis TaxID=2592656 RepID=UPI001F117921|nr:UvrD-helicase domain-containing protein [Vogesella urethralis]
MVFSFTKDSSRSLSARLNAAGARGVKCSTMHSFARSKLAELKDFVELTDKSDADQYLQNFLKHPELRSHSKQYYVLVDEAQDLNSLNYAFLTYLAKTLYAVGDFRQAIYQFRGAKPDLFQTFKTSLEQQTGTTPDMFQAPTPLVHSILTTFRNSTAVNALANAVAHQLDPSAAFTASLDTAAPGHVFTQITPDEESEYQAIKSYFLEASRSNDVHPILSSA